MKTLLGITLILASASWATPISITGEAYSGQDSSGLYVHGGNGFWFKEVGLGPSNYGICWVSQECDLSGRVGPNDENSFSGASDGVTSVDSADYPLTGRGYGWLTWVAPEIIFDALPARDSVVLVPITVSGTIMAWTTEEAESHRPPFFNYYISGTGILRSVASAPYPGGPIFLNTVRASFAGTAEPVPEPASWLLALSTIVVLVYRVTRRRARA